MLRNLHKLTLNHQGNYRKLHQEARSKYFIEGDLQSKCREVCFECITCTEARMILYDEVPMRHLSAKTRERICQTIMTPEKKAKGNWSHKRRVPVFIAGKNPIATQDCDSANIRTHEPITIEGACTLSSCFLDCIHYLITGRKVQSYRLVRTLEDRQSCEQKLLGSYYYPYHDPNKTLLSRGMNDSDMHLLAEMLGVHIYEYRDDLSPPKWSYIAGNKHGKTDRKPSTSSTGCNMRGSIRGRGTSSLLLGCVQKRHKFIQNPLLLSPFILFHISASFSFGYLISTNLDINYAHASIRSTLTIIYNKYLLAFRTFDFGLCESF